MIFSSYLQAISSKNPDLTKPVADDKIRADKKGCHRRNGQGFHLISYNEYSRSEFAKTGAAILVCF